MNVFCISFWGIAGVFFSDCWIRIIRSLQYIGLEYCTLTLIDNSIYHEYMIIILLREKGK